MNETRELAEFIADVQYSDLPREVVEKTKSLILDSIGVQLAASTKPWSKIVYRYVKGLGGPHQSSILNYGDRIPVSQAAFVNS
jgi:2-methylcitrate dehydratase PrpD